MKKMQGIVDPISLTFALVLGIAAVGAMTTNQANDQQVAQESSAETTQTTDKLVADN